MFLRILNGIIEARLQLVIEVKEVQRGFRKGCSTLMNCVVLDTMLHLGKTESPLYGALIDVSKAFDSVPHSAMLQALRAKNVDEGIITLIEQMYDKNEVQFEQYGICLPARRGIRQGDPLSPLLFNIVLDFAIGKVEALQCGFPVAKDKIGALAYADDVAIFANSERQLQCSLDIFIKALAEIGLTISSTKTYIFQVEPHKRTWISRPANIRVGEVQLRQIEVEEPFKYLGVQYTLDKGVENHHHLAELSGILQRISRLQLKPRQKIHCYVLPKLYYVWVAAFVGQCFLQQIDTEIRQYLKKWLHVMSCTTDNLWYTNKRDGGIGFPKLTDLVGLAQLKLGYTLRCQEGTIGQVVKKSGLAKKEDAVARALKVERPYNLGTLISKKKELKESYFQKWSEMRSQGKGVAYFKGDRIANDFQFNENLFPDNRYIDCLKIRTNTAGVRETLARAGGVKDVSCRSCKQPVETLGHVLGQCVLHASRRIARHNKIVNILSRHFQQRGFKVMEEPRLKAKDELLKPDLVVVKGQARVVVDVTVRLEEEGMWERAASEKTGKYQKLKDCFTDKKTFAVVPVVIGARGALPKATRIYFKKIALPSFIQKKITHIALSSSVEMVNCHLDYS